MLCILVCLGMMLVALGTLGYRKHSWTVLCSLCFSSAKDFQFAMENVVSYSILLECGFHRFLNIFSRATQLSSNIVLRDPFDSKRFCGTSSAEYSFWNVVERVAASAFETDKLLFFGVSSRIAVRAYPQLILSAIGVHIVCCSMKKGLWLTCVY